LLDSDRQSALSTPEGPVPPDGDDRSAGVGMIASWGSANPIVDFGQ
jgi:hypothetical protein